MRAFAFFCFSFFLSVNILVSHLCMTGILDHQLHNQSTVLSTNFLILQQMWGYRHLARKLTHERFLSHSFVTLGLNKVQNQFWDSFTLCLGYVYRFLRAVFNESCLKNHRWIMASLSNVTKLGFCIEMVDQYEWMKAVKIKPLSAEHS